MEDKKKLGAFKVFGALIIIIGMIALAVAPIYLFIQAALFARESVNNFWIAMDITLGVTLVAFLSAIALVLTSSSREKNES